MQAIKHYGMYICTHTAPNQCVMSTLVACMVTESVDYIYPSATLSNSVMFAACAMWHIIYVMHIAHAANHSPGLHKY